MVTSTSEKLTDLLPEPEADPVPSTSKLSSHFDISTQGLRESPMYQFPHLKSESFVDNWKSPVWRLWLSFALPIAHEVFLPHINPDLSTRAATQTLAIISALPLKSPNFVVSWAGSIKSSLRDTQTCRVFSSTFIPHEELLGFPGIPIPGRALTVPHQKQECSP